MRIGENRNPKTPPEDPAWPTSFLVGGTHTYPPKRSTDSSTWEGPCRKDVKCRAALWPFEMGGFPSPVVPELRFINDCTRPEPEPKELG